MVTKDGKTVYSYSQLNTFEQCPYSWHKLYEERVPNEDNAFSLYGTLAHSLLEQCARGEVERASLAALFDWQFDEAITKKFPPNQYVDLRESYRKQGIDFFQNFEGFDGMEILGVEEHFLYERNDYALQGYIDLTYIKDGKLVCRDWKSAKAWPKKELAEHARQPYLYAEHVRQKYGRYPDELEFFHFRQGNRKSVIPFEERDLEEAFAWADSVVEKIRYTWEYPHNYDDFFCSNLCSCRSNCQYRETERRKRFAARRS